MCSSPQSKVRRATWPSYGAPLAAVSLLLLGLPTFAQDPHAQHHNHDMTSQAAADQHAAHHAMLTEQRAVNVEQVKYAIPSITLRDQTGRAVNVQELLASGRPLAVNFVYTTCTTICPVLTALMTQFEDELRDDPNRPVVVSISIDPTYDSPQVLTEYAARFGADWTFLTGPSNDVMQVLQVFDAYRGSKVNHFALTLLRPAAASEWTRVEGLTSAHDLVRIWRGIGS